MPQFDIKALEVCFKQTSIIDSFESLYHSLGFITAAASCPEPIQPAEWIEQLVITKDKTPHFDSEEQLKVFTTNLVTWWNQCGQIFDEGDTIDLPEKIKLTPKGNPSRALVEFASGYLDGFDWLLDTWEAVLPEENEEAHRTLSVLNFIFARFINEEVMADTEPELYKQLPDTEGCFEVLPSLISGVGMLGQDLAMSEEDFEQLLADDEDEESDSVKAEPYTSAHRTVGRNDLCPCGSGKKFKKCCLH